MKQSTTAAAGMFFFLVIAFYLFSGFIPAVAYSQKKLYPIAELGNCRDQQECYYYCEVPRNTPACWSYSTYILQKNVLGVTITSPDEVAREHGITFPIPELGNCATAQACMIYCSQPQNYQVCTAFGEKKGLVKTSSQPKNTISSTVMERILVDAKAQLNCDSKASCQTLCDIPSNQQRCQQFAQSEGLVTQPTSSQISASQATILQAAQQDLGCSSISSCTQYCNNSSHYQQCQTFAAQHNLTPPSQMQQQSQQQSLPEGVVVTPPCNTPTSCAKWCTNNPEQCSTMQQNSLQQQYPTGYQYQAISPYPSVSWNQQYYPQDISNNSTTNSSFQPSSQQGNSSYAPYQGCSTQQQCYQYCQANPTQCPGFQQYNQNYPQSNYPSPNQQPFSTQQQSFSQQTPQPISSPTGTSNPQPQQGTSTNQNAPQQSAPQQSQTSVSGHSIQQQQQMCVQTPNCSWTGLTCSCPPGQGPINH